MDARFAHKDYYDSNAYYASNYTQKTGGHKNKDTFESYLNGNAHHQAEPLDNKFSKHLNHSKYDSRK